MDTPIKLGRNASVRSTYMFDFRGISTNGAMPSYMFDFRGRRTQIVSLCLLGR
jgi:hypothetical protein